jgi:hypothetical protein
LLKDEMNTYCRKLILPFELPAINFSNFKKFPRNQVACSIDLIGKDFPSWLSSSAGARLQWAEIFYLAPGQDHSIHCDGNELDNKVKINFISGGKNSKMIWYTANSAEKIIKRISPANTHFLSIHPKDTVVVHKENLVGLYIVNVGMFHNVYNNQEDRYCLSMAISDIATNRRLTYYELIQRLDS